MYLPPLPSHTHTGLRRLIQIKNKELRQMKQLAATILGQRTETEQFFLEALQEVCSLGVGVVVLYNECMSSYVADSIATAAATAVMYNV